MKNEPEAAHKLHKMPWYTSFGLKHHAWGNGVIAPLILWPRH